MNNGCTKFKKIQDPPENSEFQMTDTNESAYWGLTNSRCHCKNFIFFYGELAPWICVPLVMSTRVTETKRQSARSWRRN